jgi:hypothetical protein
MFHLFFCQTLKIYSGIINRHIELQSLGRQAARGGKQAIPT